jgi:hypothetical protein
MTLQFLGVIGSSKPSFVPRSRPKWRASSNRGQRRVADWTISWDDPKTARRLFLQLFIDKLVEATKFGNTARP